MFVTIYLIWQGITKPFGFLVFQCNCAKTDVNFIKNTFLRQVVQAWCEVTFATCEINFGNEYIWNNSNVKVDGKTLLYSNLYDKGVMKIIDLFDANNVPLDYLGFIRKYNVLNFPFTTYWGLIKAIPTQWRSNSHNTSMEPTATELLIENITVGKLSVSRIIVIQFC